MPRQKPGLSKQDYETDPRFMRAVTERFGPIVFDLAATEENRQADLFYGIEDNSLKKSWVGGAVPEGNRWLNPPFGKIMPWAMKCADTRPKLPLGSLLLFLTPLGVTKWFTDYVFEHAMVLLLKPRLTFVGHMQGFPKDCILSVYGETPGKVEIWPWR